MSNQKKYKSTEIAVQEAYCGESNAQEHRKVGIAVQWKRTENMEYVKVVTIGTLVHKDNN